jgi:F0F1-type ATP synthase epsilon subunit
MAEELVQIKSECCTAEHSQHLCYIISQGFHLSDEQEYTALVEEAEFVCKHCGRHAKCAANLCVPVPL